MYTANTMASIGEAMGLSLPGSAAPPAVDRRRDSYARASGEAVVNLIRQGITARQIMTKDAFENAITVLMALGGRPTLCCTCSPWPMRPMWTSNRGLPQDRFEGAAAR